MGTREPPAGDVVDLADLRRRRDEQSADHDARVLVACQRILDVLEAQASAFESENLITMNEASIALMRYAVASDDARVAARMIRVMHWVSQRALEEFEPEPG